MAILTHSSDLQLAPTLATVVRHQGGSVARALDQLIELGFSTVQLDAALSGIRPRELNRTARRHLAAMLARHDVRLAGIDLFVPRRHYIESRHVDRATAATVAAIELSADLGKVPLSIGLPVQQTSADVLNAIVASADGAGVRLAVHAEDQLDVLEHWIREVDLPALGAGIAPAVLLANSQDPVALVQQLGEHLTVARLSDSCHETEPGRCAVGQGDLDVPSYRVALDLATSRAGAVVLDLWGVNNPIATANAAKAVWSDA